MKTMRSFTFVLARFLISLVFLIGAINKILHWHETESELTNILCQWQNHVGFSESLDQCMSQMIPYTPFLLMVAAVFEAIGGLLLLFGIKEKWGASLLILFLIPTTILMHQFWFVDTAQARELQATHFLKNCAILGGLFLVLLKPPNDL